MLPNSIVHRLSDTYIGEIRVSTVALDTRNSFDRYGVPMPRWETVVFYPANHYEGEGDNSTDPIQWPCHRKHTLLTGFNHQIAEIGHEIVCYRLRNGVQAWAASNVSKDDIKAVIRQSADD